MNILDGTSIDSVIQASEQRKSEQDKVGQNQFLEMLVAQLENQDPLNPQDSADFAAQLAQFSTVEQLIAMRTGIDDLVSAFKEQATGGSAASRLDPAALVGREVTVFGSQIEVDAKGSPIELPLRLRDTAVTAEYKITDGKGKTVRTGSALPLDASSGKPVPMTPGDHTFSFDPAKYGLAEGVYNIEFTATDADKKPVTILPMVTGVVTGAVVAGKPAIRIGSRLFSVSDVLEVGMAPSTSAAAAKAANDGAGAL